MYQSKITPQEKPYTYAIYSIITFNKKASPGYEYIHENRNAGTMLFPPVVCYRPVHLAAELRAVYISKYLRPFQTNEFYVHMLEKKSFS